VKPRSFPAKHASTPNDFRSTSPNNDFPNPKGAPSKQSPTKLKPDRPASIPDNLPSLTRLSQRLDPANIKAHRNFNAPDQWTSSGLLRSLRPDTKIELPGNGELTDLPFHVSPAAKTTPDLQSGQPHPPHRTGQSCNPDIPNRNLQ
jgi:hypothetical protein